MEGKGLNNLQDELPGEILNLGGKLVEHRILPSRPPVFEEIKGLTEPFISALKSHGIHNFYSHQAAAWEKSSAGKNIAVSTGTASGKSLCYWLPIFNDLINNPEHTALVLFPTKALARDQLRKIKSWISSRPEMMASIRESVFDGDTPQPKRAEARKCNLLLTNPDALHVSILPYHGRWGRFFSGLHWVALDEAHVYRGVFGSHVAMVMRRLRRICSLHNNNPQWIFTSATLPDPDVTSSQLCGLDVFPIEDDGAGKGKRNLFILSPPPRSKFTKIAGTSGSAADVSAALALNGFKHLLFTRSRLQCELIGRYARNVILSLSGKNPSEFISTYRGGYVTEERRMLEKRFISGELQGLAATNALELGIDVGGLQTVVLAGFPGSFSAFWQQSGRAGRAGENANIILIAGGSALDRYLLRHPEFLENQNPEPVFLNPENEIIMEAHLAVGSREIPLKNEDDSFFGSSYHDIIDRLLKQGKIKEIRGSWYPTPDAGLAQSVSLRSVTGRQFDIIDVDKAEKPMAKADDQEVRTRLQKGAVYMAEGNVYRVLSANKDHRQVYVESFMADYYTVPIRDSYLIPKTIKKEKIRKSLRIVFSEVVQHSTIAGLKRIRFNTHANAGIEPLHFPMEPLETQAVWLLPQLSLTGPKAFSALAGFSNLLSEVIPYAIRSDSNDFSVEIDWKKSLGEDAVTIVDSVKGGAGLAIMLYEKSEQILSLAGNLLHDCPCSSGCPGCVGVGIDLPGGKSIVPEKSDVFKLFSEFE